MACSSPDLPIHDVYSRWPAVRKSHSRSHLLLPFRPPGHGQVLKRFVAQPDASTPHRKTHTHINTQEIFTTTTSSSPTVHGPNPRRLQRASRPVQLQRPIQAVPDHAVDMARLSCMLLVALLAFASTATPGEPSTAWSNE